MSLTRRDLDRAEYVLKDSAEDARVWFFNPPCHPASALKVAYDRPTGRLKIGCNLCEAFVCEIEVAEGIPCGRAFASALK
jgi:hypothetical protein